MMFSFLTSKEYCKNINLEKDIVFPIIGSDELNSWILKSPKTLCLYPYNEYEGKTSLMKLNDMKIKYPNIYTYLNFHKNKLIGRSQGRKDYSESENWYQLNRPREKWIYESVKIIYPGTTNKPKFALDTNKQLFRNARVYAYILKKEDIELYKAILPILNSTLTKYLITLKCPPKANNYYEMSTSFMESYPFVLPEEVLKQKFINMSDLMLTLNSDLQDISCKFQRTIQRQFNLEELPSRLQEWYKLSFKEFIAELGKKKIKLQSLTTSRVGRLFHAGSRQSPRHSGQNNHH